MYGKDDQNPDQPGTGDWFNDNAPETPADAGPGTGANPSGTPPPWMDQTSIGPFVAGSGWWDAPPQTDPQGRVWTWNPASNAWQMQAAAPPKPPPPRPPNPDDFGGIPKPYASDPNAPTDDPLPPYTPPTWTGGDYVNPTEADLLAMPGYQTQLNAGFQARERSAAAQGTVLNGGTLKALDRFGQDYAQTGYQTLRANTYEDYKTRYGQFQDKAGMDLNARTANANEHQTNYQNRATRYLNENNRTLSDYITNLNARRNAETDYWNRNRDLSDAGRR